MALNDIGLIGMGHVGSGMAKVLLEDGLVVHGLDADPARMDAARKIGVTTEKSPKDVGANSEVIILSLPQSEIVEEVCLGAGGIIESGNKGLLVIDCTSGYPDHTIRIAEKLATAGIRMIDAPITGGEGGGAHAAPQRGLTMIVGGDKKNVEEAWPVLERMSKHLFAVGKLGNGHLIKAVNNMATFAALVSTVEGMLVGAKHGVNTKLMAETMAAGTGQNFHLRRFIANAPEGTPASKAQFSIGLATKDLKHMIEIARRSGVPMAMGDMYRHLGEIFTATLGYDADTRDLVGIMEQWAGVSLDDAPAASDATANAGSEEDLAGKVIGIIGMGNLGSGMAKVMREDGRIVHGFDTDPARRQVAEQMGIVVEDSAKAVAAAADMVILSLPQSDIVSDVCFGEHGIAASGKKNLLVIDTTSGLPSKTLQIGARLKDAGMRMIDAPITGGAGGGATAAPNRGITMIIGGGDEDISEAAPLLRSLSKHLFVVGPLGHGHLIKAINNMVGFCAGIATVEGLLVAAKHGVPTDLAAQCMNVGTGQSFHLKRLMAGGKPKPRGANEPKGGFYIGLMCKDMRHMSEIAKDAGVPTIASDQAFHLAEIFTAELGFDANISDMDKVMEKWAGVRLDGTLIDRD